METVLIGCGMNENVELQIDPTNQAGRMSLRPIEHKVGSIIGGHYSIGSMTGLMTAGIASLAQVFQVRWADATKIFGLKKLMVQFSTATGFAATTVGAPVELIIGHNTTAGGSGGTALAPTLNRMRATHGVTAFLSSGEIRIATTAALTAATGQGLEAAPVSSCMGADNRTLVSTAPFALFEQREHGDHPLVLVNGDTLVIRTNSPAATGTWYMSVFMSWFEAVDF